MAKRDEIEVVIADFEREVADAAARATVRIRTLAFDVEVVPQASWLPLKEVARRIGKSERATWAAAQKVPDYSWLHGGRRLVNIDLIRVMTPPSP